MALLIRIDHSHTRISQTAQLQGFAQFILADVVYTCECPIGNRLLKSDFVFIFKKSAATVGFLNTI